MLNTAVTTLIRCPAHRSSFKIRMMVNLMWMLISSTPSVSVFIYKTGFIGRCSFDALPIYSGALEISRIILSYFKTLNKLISLRGSTLTVSNTLNGMLKGMVN